MAKQGSSLEQLVKAIQTTIKDSPNTFVQTNVKIEDTNGIKREIDVLVEDSNTSPTTLIAFECKDYNKAVDVQIVDAVVGKFADIPSIQKTVIVANKGYSTSAKIKAAKHGIELRTLSKVPLTQLLLNSTPILAREMETVLLDTAFLVDHPSSPGEQTLINIADTIEKSIKYEMLFYKHPPIYDEIKLQELGEKFAKNDLKPIEDDLCLEASRPFPIMDISGRIYMAKAIIYHVKIIIYPQKGKLVEQRTTPRDADEVIAAEYKIDEEFSMVAVKTSDKNITYLKTKDNELHPPKRYE